MLYSVAVDPTLALQVIVECSVASASLEKEWLHVAAQGPGDTLLFSSWREIETHLLGNICFRIASRYTAQSES